MIPKIFIDWSGTELSKRNVDKVILIKLRYMHACNYHSESPLYN
jgi:hypothetical protein